jgi:hypothetical protein
MLALGTLRSPGPRRRRARLNRYLRGGSRLSVPGDWPSPMCGIFAMISAFTPTRRRA